MYTLLHGLYKYLVQKDEYFILILGLDNAGKTTYLEAAKTKFTKNYKGMNPCKITTTVGLNIGKIDIAGVRFNFWDLGGQEELRSLWDKYYAESHAVIYIVDSSDREKIPESKETFDRVISSEHLIGVPLLVLANKQDVPDCMGVREVKPIFNQNAHLIGRRDCMVMPVSALNGDGIDEGIHWLVDCVKRNNDVRPPRNQNDNCLS
ncbi:ADP-ribosylation factor-related protein 1 [Bombus vosnesenskii]|uniref:ADP-ribosylation factor-related protein 1 n=4 Tax=Bombus TaxID=28641 RepID=A0A6J3LDW5_9HYME|nr:ADP-ribosylation factor-related protein 1 [Bombus terrestris]XP_003486850.1 ADP-ribosylation factor-related protein 1 [Bombus impatiens]XP_033190553.1 ADP-ribosylation factor-related protein 1 [Bombus vancouverensis nearcticus]XP_033308751.1 ADP-ribosylation factor-related protein 1 [Bombus bifarius]XP_033363773.1 ADP-ribosylation factor-related protein 1 [Bombus vosnesenskii]XP_043596303.1 ADP-ribosylation factor-related protein 1 [Bombus pyrosoma]XP_043596304.1 ADP-ribosylation factor-re